MEKTVLENELVLARRRLIDQSIAVKEAESVMDYAARTSLPTVERIARAKLKRVLKAFKETEVLVGELEKASGALPLKPSGKA